MDAIFRDQDFHYAGDLQPATRDLQRPPRIPMPAGAPDCQGLKLATRSYRFHPAKYAVPPIDPWIYYLALQNNRNNVV